MRQLLALEIKEYEDDEPSILKLRAESGDFIHPDLLERVAEAIKRYPRSNAEHWLGPVAAVLAVEAWLADPGRSPKEEQ